MKPTPLLLSVIALLGIAHSAQAGITVTYHSPQPVHHYARPHFVPTTAYVQHFSPHVRHDVRRPHCKHVGHGRTHSYGYGHNYSRNHRNWHR